MKRVTLLLLLTAACAATPPPERGPPVPDVLPYSGEDFWHPLVLDAAATLEERTLDAARVVQAKLGLTLSPERRRTLALAAGRETVWIETRLIEGRSLQRILVPGAPLVHGEVGIDALLREALCRATLTDTPMGVLPDWYVRGAPLYASGVLTRRLYERLLSGDRIPTGADPVAPPLDLDAPGNDEVSAALFFRFLAEEFGDERLPTLAHAFLATPDRDQAYRASFGSDPASLPVAFDGFRRRVVGDLLEDPEVLSLAEARLLSGTERIQRLAALVGKSSNGYVSAAVLDDLAVASFRAGDVETAAALCEQVTREQPGRSFHRDRNRFILALAGTRRVADGTAPEALDDFVSEYPESAYAPSAALNAALRVARGGGEEEARRRLEELAAEYPGTDAAREAHHHLAERALSAHRYALARRHLELALPLEQAASRLAELDRSTEDELPAAERDLVGKALRDLASPDQATAERGAQALAEIGPRAEPQIRHALGLGDGMASFAHATLALRMLMVRVYAYWPLADATGPLTRLLTDPEERVARAALEALLGLGIKSSEVDRIIEGHPGDTGAARTVYGERFGTIAVPEVRDLMASDDHRDRIEAARALGALEKPGALEALARLTGDTSPQVRREAAAALGHREEAAAAEILTGALSDPSPLVRLEAVRSLVRIGRLVPVRESGLMDADGRIRIAASRALLEKAEPTDAPRVVALLDDRDPAVRTAVTGLLGTVEGIDVGPALADALRSAEDTGFAMRIVRVMAHLVGTDFGYDPVGADDERQRVAEAFLVEWRERRGSR